jgi:hypothetical protein
MLGDFASLAQKSRAAERFSANHLPPGRGVLDYGDDDGFADG